MLICAQNLGGLKHLQLNRQLFTAFAATGLEHLSPAFSTPAGPKAVHLFATPPLGLIGSFRHDVLSSLGMNVRQDIIPCFATNCQITATANQLPLRVCAFHQLER